MDFKELKNKTPDELQILLKEKRNKLVMLRFTLSSRKLKNFNEIKETKKDIARILTLLNKEKTKT